MMFRLVASVLSVLLVASAVRADEAQEKIEKANKAVWAFEQTLSPLSKDPDAKGNKELEAKVRTFFNGLKDRETKIAAIGMMDSRYVYHIPKELTAELLGKLLKDPDKKVRDRAAHALGYNGLGGRFADDLLAMLDKADAATKQSVIYAIGRGEDKRFVPALKKLMHDADRNVQMQAAFQLSWRPAEEVAAEFRKLLDHPDEGIRAVGLHNLARYSGEKPPLPLSDLEKYLDDPSQNMRLTAIESLALRGGPGSAARLAKLLDDPSPYIRTQVLKTLGGLKATSQAEAVVKRLADDDVVVRRHAVIAMEFVGKDRAAELRPFLKDEDYQVRQHAARILGLFRDRAAAPDLLKLLDDKDTQVRREAVKALAKIDAKTYADALAGCTTDADEQVRMFATRGLGASGEARFRKRLEELAAKDPSDFVRDQARYALTLLDRQK
jgi:HEAT repeat protein